MSARAGITPDERADLLATLSGFGLPEHPTWELALLRRRPAHLVCRVSRPGESYVLKRFYDKGLPLEPQVYAALLAAGVPVLPMHGRDSHALLLEDLAHSGTWRQATEADRSRAATGTAVAKWYRRLHSAGFARPEGLPGFLDPWYARFTSGTLAEIGMRFELTGAPGWQAAQAQLPVLQSAAARQPHTWIYDDFDMENLALTRRASGELRAVVYDYDQFTTGFVYSDYRNVSYGLTGPARAAFQSAYGPVSETERVLDEPLALLFGLVVAAERERFPGWAEPLLADVRSGRFAQAVEEALRQVG